MYQTPRANEDNIANHQRIIFLKKYIIYDILI